MHLCVHSCTHTPPHTLHDKLSTHTYRNTEWERCILAGPTKSFLKKIMCVHVCAHMCIYPGRNVSDPRSHLTCLKNQTEERQASFTADSLTSPKKPFQVPRLELLKTPSYLQKMILFSEIEFLKIHKTTTRDKTNKPIQSWKKFEAEDTPLTTSLSVLLERNRLSVCEESHWYSPLSVTHD